jgi:protein arginine kinase activator
MAERPVECSHCKKPIKISYKEVIGEAVFCTDMCADCPIFQQKLHGQSVPVSPECWAEGETGLCCGNCLTTLESIKTGNPLGCSNCYAIFGDLLLGEMAASDHLPYRMKKEISSKKSLPVHIGKSPSKTLSIPASSRLTALNEALNEALKRENYEQAAWLRDQIKELMDNPNERKNEPS